MTDFNAADFAAAHASGLRAQRPEAGDVEDPSAPDVLAKYPEAIFRDLRRYFAILRDFTRFPACPRDVAQYARPALRDES